MLINRRPAAERDRPNSSSLVEPCPGGCGHERALCLAERLHWMHYERGKDEDLAMAQLEGRYEREIEAAMRRGIFRSIDERERERLWGEDSSTEQEVRWTALEWLLAEGHLELRHGAVAAADLLLGDAGPPLRARLAPRMEDWLRALRGCPLGLYEVRAVRPRVGALLYDLRAAREVAITMWMPEAELAIGEILGLRLVPWHGDMVLSNAIYSLGPTDLAELEALRQMPEQELGPAILAAWLRDVGRRATPLPPLEE